MKLDRSLSRSSLCEVRFLSISRLAIPVACESRVLPSIPIFLSLSSFSREKKKRKSIPSSARTSRQIESFVRRSLARWRTNSPGKRRDVPLREEREREKKRRRESVLRFSFQRGEQRFIVSLLHPSFLSLSLFLYYYLENGRVGDFYRPFCKRYRWMNSG